MTIFKSQGMSPTDVAARKYLSLKDGRLERGSEKMQGWEGWSYEVKNCLCCCCLHLVTGEEQKSIGI
ncbi:hypothetical protein SLEP1_g55262 [Rubroshorea leprosula]|uniref:Uncharacterized protein n=1 Tax=Rubroshorea leprosula TaxID=152421 RepID=A0AAV5MH00_9ROSI|nr:hypothetical protein SLEP1_g55262 [Rubroshorea leprosula]